MSTIQDPRARKPWLRRQRPWPPRNGIFRFTVDQVCRLEGLGFFGDRHVELLEGVIYEMTFNTPHATSTSLSLIVLQATFPGCHVRPGLPMDISRRSLPEPDFAVVFGGPRDFVEQHPTTALLLVEISDATLRKDRTLKAHLYAQGGIADYWIVNLVDRQLEIHRSPGPDPSRKGRSRYSDITVVAADGHASPLARPEAVVAVADLLP